MEEREATEIRCALRNLRSANGNGLRVMYDAENEERTGDEMKYARAYGMSRQAMNHSFSEVANAINLLETLLDEEGLDVD